MFNWFTSIVRATKNNEQQHVNNTSTHLNKHNHNIKNTTSTLKIKQIKVARMNTIKQ